VPSLSQEPFFAFLMTPDAPEPDFLLDSALNRPSWQESGAGGDSDPNIFFPVRGQSILPAVAICQTCAVQPECLRYGLEHSHLVGIWGGTSERQRRLLRRPSA
jgi:WhiB family redox-sensing transcriptional regulator